MATTRQMLDAFASVRGPYLYHGGETDPEQLLSEGIRPRAEIGGNGADKGRPELRSRPGHVYLATREHLERLPLQPLVRVDTRLLDPELVCVDEDSIWEMQQRAERLAELGPDDQEWDQLPVLAASMRRWAEAGCSFGDWADVYSELVDQPHWVALSLAYGSLAYAGPVPVEALSALA